MSEEKTKTSSENFAQAVADYKDKFKSEAEDLVQNVFPRKITELNALLADERFALERREAIIDDVNIPIPEIKRYTSIIKEGEPPSKRIRICKIANNFHLDLRSIKIRQVRCLL